VLAVLGVSDKRDIGRLAGGLLGLGWEVVATDGTRGAISQSGHATGSIADLAGVPTLLGGRVKALTVSVMAGILATDTASDLAELQQYNIRRVSLVCCNFVPVPQLAPDAARLWDSVDIGGPAMLRAAAKNCAHVIPLADPDDYPDVLAALADGDGTAASVPLGYRMTLAAKAFLLSSEYDQQVFTRFHEFRGGEVELRNAAGGGPPVSSQR
jgi:AICAR transformylase/IMP cyclohydrolase PurH